MADNNEPKSEDWCFKCKDGGEMVICDFEGCQKPYHHGCVGKSKSYFKSGKQWNCAWHSCNLCKKGSHVYCYTCTNSFCDGCIPRAGFLQVKDKYGLCDECHKLAILIEENKNYDSDGDEVDFTNIDTVEGLFKEYYEIIKRQEGFEAKDIYAAQGRFKKQPAGSVSELSEKEEDFDNDCCIVIQKKKGRETNKEDEINEETDSDSWCFECKDGGEMVICDFKGCQKAYHHKCVGKSKSYFKRLRRPWNCAWHSCNSCKKSSDVHCYTCKTSFCDQCIPRPDFLQVKDKYGLCKECLELALLIEQNMNCDSRGFKVDLTDLETREGLYKEYYEIIKVQEGFEARDIYAAQDRVKPEKKQPAESGAGLFGDDEVGSDNASYAAIVIDNMNLIYLKKSVLYELRKEPDSFEEKVIGCFVRVSLDDHFARKRQQLVQVNGIRKVQDGENSPDYILEFSVMPNETRISMVSNGDFYEDEFEDLKKKLLAGVFKWPKFTELEKKAKILHADIKKDWIKKETSILKSLLDRANAEGSRSEYKRYSEKIKLLETPSEQQRLLDKVPTVITNIIEPDSNVKNIKDERQKLLKKVLNKIPGIVEPNSAIKKQNSLGNVPIVTPDINELANINKDMKSDEVVDPKKGNSPLTSDGSQNKGTLGIYERLDQQDARISSIEQMVRNLCEALDVKVSGPAGVNSTTDVGAKKGRKRKVAPHDTQAMIDNMKKGRLEPKYILEEHVGEDSES